MNRNGSNGSLRELLFLRLDSTPVLHMRSIPRNLPLYSFRFCRMSTTGEAPKPEGYLVLSNISKNHNIGNMVRSACAFGMKEVLACSPQ